MPCDPFTARCFSNTRLWGEPHLGPPFYSSKWVHFRWLMVVLPAYMEEGGHNWVSEMLRDACQPKPGKGPGYVNREAGMEAW